MDMMLKHFKTPEDKTTYKETKSLEVKAKWPTAGVVTHQDGKTIEAEATEVDDGGEQS
jgi:hypothetical protein